MFETEAKSYLDNYERLRFEILNLDDFLLSYTLDLRLNSEEYTKQKHRLNSLGVDELKINKSDLYHFESQTIYIGGEDA